MENVNKAIKYLKSCRYDIETQGETYIGSNASEHVKTAISALQALEKEKKMRSDIKCSPINEKDALPTEVVKIIFNDKCVKKFCSYDSEINLDNCLQIAKENGFEYGTIDVIAESYLSGMVYTYGNYESDKWYLVGTTQGFA